jgi:hypothetical protein
VRDRIVKLFFIDFGISIIGLLYMNNGLLYYGNILVTRLLVWHRPTLSLNQAVSRNYFDHRAPAPSPIYFYRATGDQIHSTLSQIERGPNPSIARHRRRQSPSSSPPSSACRPNFVEWSSRYEKNPSHGHLKISHISYYNSWLGQLRG